LPALANEPAVPSLQRLMKRQAQSESLCYRAGEVGQLIAINSNVLKHFLKHRQTSSTTSEVGGQLFARFSPDRLCIRVATGPANEDQGGRFWFKPNQKRQNDEIQKLFKEKLHFIGDWHTHPEPTPTPSVTDLKSMQDCFNKSRHQLKSFVMVIVGQADFPEGLWVSIHNKRGFHRLSPVIESCQNTKGEIHEI